MTAPGASGGEMNDSNTIEKFILNAASQFPESTHGFYIDSVIWKEHLEYLPNVGPPYLIRRDDLYRAYEKEVLNKAVILTLMWGYPRGGRGNNIAKAIDSLNRQSCEWKKLPKFGNVLTESSYNDLLEIKGIGLSTLSKILNFNRNVVSGCPCIIFDEVMFSAFKKPPFLSWKTRDGKELKHYNKNLSFEKYATYLQIMYERCNTPQQLEATIFCFKQLHART